MMTVPSCTDCLNGLNETSSSGAINPTAPELIVGVKDPI